MGRPRNVSYGSRCAPIDFYGLKFRRQMPMGPYIVDFYCEEQKLVIELDGGSHVFKAAYEETRESYLRSLGVKVMHIRNFDAINTTAWVLNRIASELGLAQFEK
jgi:very-short-patch-repair endonuclease